VAAAAGATLGLAGEEGGGDGGAQAVVDGEVAGAEVVAENRRLVDGATRHLLEEHEHHAVDPRRRPRALVAYHLATCMRACMQPIIGNADPCIRNHPCIDFSFSFNYRDFLRNKNITCI